MARIVDSTTVSVLSEILATKRDEVTLLHRPQTRSLLRSQALDAAPTRDFAEALRRPDGNLAVIAEFKRRSPSKGDLALHLDPHNVATEYAKGGASAMSVLTDSAFFGGRIDDLQAAREVVEIPVLRKDFTIDEVQIYETRAIGADALLLILAALSDDALVIDLQELAWSLGLAVLVEAHTPEEIERGVRLGAQILGVNARDLKTFAEDLEGAAAMAAAIPTGTIAVAESSIRSQADAEAMASAGFDAVLVGEALIRSDDPAAFVSAMASIGVGKRNTSS